MQKEAPRKKSIKQQEEYLVTNLKALLQEKVWLLDTRLRNKRLLSPYQSLTEAEAKVLAALRGEHLSISEVARRLSVTRQATHKIITSLSNKQLVRLDQVEGNARDKIIVFTPAGEKMKQKAANFLRDLENEVAHAIGHQRLRLLKQLLQMDW